MFPLQGGQGLNYQAQYTDDVFDCHVYPGNGAIQTFSTTVDLATYGGMYWIRTRGGSGYQGNAIWSSPMFGSNGQQFGAYVASDSPAGEALYTAAAKPALSANQFNVPSWLSVSTDDYVAWVFRKARKFFDTVVYTGDGTTNRAVPHGLGSVPGCIIVKALDGGSTAWKVYHASLGANFALRLDSTFGSNAEPTFPIGHSETTFYVQGAANTNAVRFVAYIFANDTDSTGFIRTGLYVGNGSTSPGPVVNFGWEPQWVLIKNISASGGSWMVVDTARGLTWDGTSEGVVNCEGTTAESTGTYVGAYNTGFQVKTTNANFNTTGESYVYIAVRRPTKPATTGTSVMDVLTGFSSQTVSPTNTAKADLLISFGNRTTPTSPAWLFADRTRGYKTTADGGSPILDSSSVNGQANRATTPFINLNSRKNEVSFDPTANSFAIALRRAPHFFDIVCYEGTGVQQGLNHALGKIPAIIIVKRFDAASSTGWAVNPGPAGSNFIMWLNTTDFRSTNSAYFPAAANSSNFTVGTDSNVNASGGKYVAYLFATTNGLSTFVSYIGDGGTVNTNGTGQTLSGSFTSGARLAIIKRSSDVGSWYVFDTARGVVAGNDPYVLANSNAAEVSTVDVVDPQSSGIIVNQTSGTNLNVTSESYYYLIIA